MKGYINLELGGQKRGIKFGNRALLDIMAKHQGADNGTLTFSFDLVADLVYFGLVNNCMNAKQNVDFTPDEVIAWVDDIPMDKLLEIFTVFSDSYTGEAAPGTGKKITKLAAAKEKK